MKRTGIVLSILGAACAEAAFLSGGMTTTEWLGLHAGLFLFGAFLVLSYWFMVEEGQ